MKSAIGASFVEQMGWGESKPFAALEAYAVAEGQADAALTALIDFLEANADEIIEHGVRSHLGLRAALIAALRDEGTEKP
jgi:hypothetical protein